LKTYEKANYLVIFQTDRKLPVPKEYYKMKESLLERVEKIPGCVGRDSVRDDQGLGVTVSYWENIDAIKTWLHDEVHQKAQGLGKSKWYNSFKTVVCKIERQKSWEL